MAVIGRLWVFRGRGLIQGLAEVGGGKVRIETKI